MKKLSLSVAVLISIATTQAFALDKIDSAKSLQAAISAANENANIDKIVFQKGAQIILSEPVIYTGTQALYIEGSHAVINGSKVGKSETFYDKIEKLTTVRTSDGTLMFNTAANISIKDLSIVNSHTRGMVVNVPLNATGHDIQVVLNNVTISNSALYGLHIDDNASEFDDAGNGSEIGINLQISNSKFNDNGTGAIDFDGIRVDERQSGSITATITDSLVTHNGGDGIEFDEGGNGSVKANLVNVSFNENGFYNKVDLDDAFDVDEAGNGDIDITLVDVSMESNKDQALDLDEAGNGDANVFLYNFFANNTLKEAIKIDEEDAGDINANFTKVRIKSSHDDGIQLTEVGHGKINAILNDLKSTGNKKYGFKAQQWMVEDEGTQVEPKGVILFEGVTLAKNKKGASKNHAVVIK